MKIHYAVKFIVDIACGKNSYYQKICQHCKCVINSHFLKTTFNKKEVTCKNCKRTKAFKA